MSIAFLVDGMIQYVWKK